MNNYLIFYFVLLLIIDLLNNQYTVKKEDFLLFIIIKNLFGELIGNYIYDYLNDNNSFSMNGKWFVLNFSWGQLGVFDFTLYLEFNTAEKKINTNKIEKYRTTDTPNIQGEEMKKIEQRKSIISVDDNDGNNINNNKDHEYNLNDFIKK